MDTSFHSIVAKKKRGEPFLPVSEIQVTKLIMI